MKNKLNTSYDNFLGVKPIIGVVRLLPLLGYKNFSSIDEIVSIALNDIQILEKAGFDGALIDNHAHPHVIKSTSEMTACFSVVMQNLVEHTKIPLGVQFLIDDPEASLAIARVSGASFIRTDFFVDEVKTEYGIIKPNAKKIVTFRKKLKGESILLFADVQVKHTEMLTKNKTISTSVKQALKAGADAIVVTGKWTGIAPDIKKLQSAKKVAGDKPVFIGSGLDSQNGNILLSECNGALVGTSVRNGSRVDLKKALLLVQTIKKGDGIHGN
jgi:hypothetical protein